MKEPKQDPTPGKPQCEWFVMCPNDATKTRPHPTLGDVPICDRCDEMMERL